MNFSNELNKYMNLLDCNSKDICNISGLSPAIVSRYLNGKRTPKINSVYFNKIVDSIYLISKDKNIKLKKNDILAVGNYPEVRNCQDWYLWTNLLMNGYKLYNIQDILVYMREDRTTFKRRAGMRYFKIQKHLYDKMREKKFISMPMYMTAVSVRFCSAMLINSK